VQVFLIRHADAVSTSFELRDRDRHLTMTGRRQARALGDRLRWHDCVPTHVWSSPLVRAVQTAELVASGLQCELAIEAVPALTPDASPREAITALSALAAGTADASVVVIGHEPNLSLVAGLLIGRPTLAGLAKAEAVRIDNGAVRWRFTWDADAPDIVTR
jgi:phosphohistidine phosphatase